MFIFSLEIFYLLLAFDFSSFIKQNMLTASYGSVHNSRQVAPETDKSSDCTAN